MTTKLRDDPRHAAEAKLAADMAGKLNSLIDLERELLSAKVEAESANRDTNAHANAVQILAGGDGFSPTKAAELTECRRQIGILRLAVPVQNAKVHEIARELSRERCEQARPEHVAAVSEVVKALHALHAANVAERAVRAGVEADGYESHYLPALQVAAIGGLNESDTPAAYFCKEAEWYIRRSDPALDSAPKVRVLATHRLPDLGIEAGEVVELSARAAHELAYIRAVDMRAPLPANTPAKGILAKVADAILS